MFPYHNQLYLEQAGKMIERLSVDVKLENRKYGGTALALLHAQRGGPAQHAQRPVGLLPRQSLRLDRFGQGKLGQRSNRANTRRRRPRHLPVVQCTDRRHQNPFRRRKGSFFEFIIKK